MWTLIESIINVILNLLLPEIEQDALHNRRLTPFIKFSILITIFLAVFTVLALILYFAVSAPFIITIIILVDAASIIFWVYKAYKNTQERENAREDKSGEKP